MLGAFIRAGRCYIGSPLFRRRSACLPPIVSHWLESGRPKQITRSSTSSLNLRLRGAAPPLRDPKRSLSLSFMYHKCTNSLSLSLVQSFHTLATFARSCIQSAYRGSPCTDIAPTRMASKQTMHRAGGSVSSGSAARLSIGRSTFATDGTKHRWARQNGGG